MEAFGYFKQVIMGKTNRVKKVHISIELPSWTH